MPPSLEENSDETHVSADVGLSFTTSEKLHSTQPHNHSSRLDDFQKPPIVFTYTERSGPVLLLVLSPPLPLPLTFLVNILLVPLFKLVFLHGSRPGGRGESL